MVSESHTKSLCVVGLGYVGFPLAEAFSHHIQTIGYDVDQNKVDEINKSGSHFIAVADPREIKKADFILICVPTPITKAKDPDLNPVMSAATIVGQNLKPGSIVVLESTVYPGVTEEIVLPILEKESKMVCGKDFFIGYSPERINPNDEQHSIEKITKVVSGMNKDVSDALCELYGFITQVYRAKDIRTAEAAKVIENIQRDLNIALMNELSLLFSIMGLDTHAVLEAAGTKWNFHNYQPGLVGGHCIPVDPYYLVYKAKELGYHPRVILAGRSINDSMPHHIVNLTIKGLNEGKKVINGSNILIMGLTYKENVPDTRESPAEIIIHELQKFKINVYGYDPLLQEKSIEKLGAKPLPNLDLTMDGIIIAVAHKEFMSLPVINLRNLMNDNPVLIDVRGIINQSEAEEAGIFYQKL